MTVEKKRTDLALAASSMTASILSRSVFWALIAVPGIASHTVRAGDTELPSDVSVVVSAFPTQNIQPEQTIDITVTVTNDGAVELPVVITESSVFVDEMTLGAFNAEECYLLLVVGDLANGGYDYRIDWDVASAYAGTAPALEPGETRVCHFQIRLTAHAPAIYDFSFGLAPSFHDPDPNNDRGTVILERAPPNATSVPTLSLPAIVCAGVILIMSGLADFWRWRT